MTRFIYFLRVILTSPRGQLFSEAFHYFVSEISEGDANHSLDPLDEPADPGEGLGQLVGVVVTTAGGRQVGSPKTAEQQSQEKVQNLKVIFKRKKNIYQSS
jgi:hypothetical protein